MKVYSSESETPKIEKPINLVDSILKSVYELNKFFRNNDFVRNYLEVVLITKTQGFSFSFYYIWKTNYKNFISNQNV